MAVLETTQFEQLVTEVKQQLLAESQGVGDVEVVSSLSGINSLPALRGNAVVEAPLELLATPAVEAAGRADQAAKDALDTANHPTYVGQDNYVYAWDKAAQAYNKTSIYVRGEGFKISKTYASIAEMESDTEHGLKEGDFVLINADDVENPDNAKIYTVNAENQFTFLVDMSGAIGFTGKTPQIEVGIITVGVGREDAGAALSDNGVDEEGNPKYLLNLRIPSIRLEDLTEEEIAELQSPASGMIAKLEETDNLAKANEEAREDAESLRRQSEDKRIEAELGRVESESLRKEAEDARALAEGSRVTAESVRVQEHEELKANSEEATADANRAAESARNTPVIKNGSWWIFNEESGEYVDSFTPATGKSPQIANGTWWTWDETSNTLVDSGISVSSDYQLTKEKVEGVLLGNVDSHWHDRYVEKVEGKQLSAEDFTTALKEKLESMSAYDDTEITQAVESLRSDFDTLVSGDASAAIDSFNEVTAFLQGLEDSEDLDSIIAAIEQQIAAKQDKIDDLASIREGASKGATALQDIPSGYAKTEDIPTKVSELENDSEYYQPIKSGNITYTVEFPDSSFMQVSSDLPLNVELFDGKTIRRVTSIVTNKYGGITSTGGVSSPFYKQKINGATTEKAGFMSASDKTKLDGLSKIEVVDHGTEDLTFALTPNTYHKWGEVTSLDLTLAEPADSTVYNEYMFEFTSGATATSLSLPDTIKWVTAPVIVEGLTYLGSIVNNIGVIVSA